MKRGETIMSLFFEENKKLIFRQGGETVQIIPWGKNSFRVVSRILGEIDNSSIALIEQTSCDDVKIEIGEETATITNGKIKVFLDTRGWQETPVISFFNDNEELLLKEIGRGGALFFKSTSL